MILTTCIHGPRKYLPWGSIWARHGPDMTMCMILGTCIYGSRKYLPQDQIWARYVLGMRQLDHMHDFKYIHAHMGPENTSLGIRCELGMGQERGSSTISSSYLAHAQLISDPKGGSFGTHVCMYLKSCIWPNYLTPSPHLAHIESQGRYFLDPCMHVPKIMHMV